ncbi:MAG: hypothetical protein AB9866_15345 [Syntrophobacteraceae bacterium]
MAKQVIGHLDEERIAEAIIDRNSLDEDARRHLSECSACRAEIDALADGLAKFGQISRKNAPIPRRRLRVPGGEARVSKPVWKISPAFGAGLVFAVILAVVLNPLYYKKSTKPNLEKVYLEMLQDERFMAEIETLEENSLPRFYVDILGPPDGSDDIDDDSPGGQNEKVT